MNTLLLCGIGVWLLLLTFLVSRLLVMLVDFRKLIPVEHDGKPLRRINGPLPAEAAAVFGRIGAGPELSAAAFAEGDASSLRQARLIEPADVTPGRTVFLVTGGDDGDPVHQALAGTGARVLRDPEADAILRALDVDAPLAFEISGGEVVAQFHLGRDGSFGRFSTLIRQHRGRIGAR
ncbi:hypothetical protein [Amycolatopsis vastitatis]|uniref:Uncharacterized protein n=1 Tax=Amycolatopsis vastitatis TaxID=1905142 RepID=A0A229SYA2_9PSEU|nr:hypothetical protein [Amycolatopsis vastitatis]OXM64045.1 hypothetical protein CF165_27235 [Amycolatopsis vastitatis]